MAAPKATSRNLSGLAPLTLQLGKAGPRITAGAGFLEAWNAAGTALVPVKVALPQGPADASPMAFTVAMAVVLG